MKSSSVNWPFSELGGQARLLVLIELGHGLVDEADDVAHAEDALGHAFRAELFEAIEFLTNTQEFDRLAGG